MERLDKGTVWITGASSGLGYHTAKALVQEGYLVIAGARSFKPYEGPCECGSHRIPLDVRSPESVAAFRDLALKISPRVDALYNCAGVLILGSCEETGRDEYQRVMETNFLGTVEMTRAALPVMRAQRSGRIINFSSVNGVLGIPFQSAYTASKHAIEGYSSACRWKSGGLASACVWSSRAITGAARRPTEPAPQPSKKIPHIRKYFTAASRPLRETRRTAAIPKSLAASRRRSFEKNGFRSESAWRPSISTWRSCCTRSFPPG